MTVRSLSGVPDSQVKSYANEAETTKYHLLGQSGDSQAETAGLPEDTPDLSSKLIESHLQLLVRLLRISHFLRSTSRSCQISVYNCSFGKRSRIAFIMWKEILRLFY